MDAGTGEESSERTVGRVRLRGQQAERSAPGGSTTDQRLLDGRGSADWVHTDPWRVVTIMRLFVSPAPTGRSR
jgi:hypothetical protein